MYLFNSYLYTVFILYILFNLTRYYDDVKVNGANYVQRSWLDLAEADEFTDEMLNNPMNRGFYFILMN